MIKKYRRPYRIKKKKSIFKNRFFWLGILILLIFGGIFYLICFSFPFQIKEIQITGNEKTNIDNLNNLIKDKLSQKILFFTSKSIFLVNFSEIKKEISKNFPPIGEIILKRKFPDKIIVQIEERKPIAVFNQEDLYFFLDKEGIIFDPVRTNISNGVENTLADGQLIKIKKVLEAKELKLGDRVLDKELLSSILEIESKLENNLKGPIEEVLVVSDERINLKTSEGWEIYLNPKGDIEWQLTKLRVDLEEEIPQERRKDLEYIELRFGNFAPYKYKEF
jgi:cell division protein FtsQ